MTEKATKTRCGGTMTESAYLAWIRSALRSKSLRWPPRAKALELARRSYKGDNKLQKWEYECAICHKWWKAKKVVVDHYPKRAGSILHWRDIGEFCNNLYCETDNLRVLCSPCHDVHTLSEKNGISFEEAQFQKDVIDIMKRPIIEILAFCQDYGYNESMLSNAAKRKEAVTTILKEKSCE